MALIPPPPPVKSEPGSFAWMDWYKKLYDYLNTAGSVLWSSLNFTGSNLTDLVTRLHSSLQGIQGGVVGEYYHLTAGELLALQLSKSTTSVAVNTTLDDAYGTVIVTATGKTITLPAASTARIGNVWTIIQNVVGYVDITRAGSDTLVLPDSNTTIRIDTKGASISLKCITSSSWGIV